MATEKRIVAMVTFLEESDAFIKRRQRNDEEDIEGIIKEVEEREGYGKRRGMSRRGKKTPKGRGRLSGAGGCYKSNQHGRHHNLENISTSKQIFSAIRTIIPAVLLILYILLPRTARRHRVLNSFRCLAR